MVTLRAIVVSGRSRRCRPPISASSSTSTSVGAVALTNLALPRQRASRGRNVFVSSLSGLISTPMTGAYNASKFAIEAIADAGAWSCGLGIKVILVELAMTDTDLWRKAPETLELEAAEVSAEQASSTPSTWTG